MQKRLTLSNLRSSFYKYLVATVILAVPLYPKFPFISIPGTYVSIRIEDFLLALSFGATAIFILKDFKEFLKNHLFRIFSLFFLIAFISVLSAVFLTKTALPHIGILHLLRRVEYMGCFFVGFYALGGKNKLSFYIKCLMIVVIYAFIYGFGQKYWAWPVITTQNFEYSKGVALRFMPGGHLVSTFAGHYDLASFLILVMPLFLLIVTSGKKILELFSFGGVWRTRIAVFSIFLMSFWLLVNTASRISIFAFVLSTLFALLISKRKKFIIPFLILSVVFVSLSSNLISRYTQIFDVYIKRMIPSFNQSSLFIGEVFAQGSEGGIKRISSQTPTPVSIPVFEDRSTSIRLNVEWPRAIRALTKNPLLGTGYSSITLATDNDYLRLLGEVGILGTIGFLNIICYILFKSLSFVIKTYNNQETIGKIFVISIFSSIFGVLTNALFIDVFESSKFAILLWLLIGFSFKVIKNKDYEQ